MEVLRWDKENQLAQKYIQKLQNEYDTGLQFQNLKNKIFPKNALTTYILFGVMVLLFGYYILTNGILTTLFSTSGNPLKSNQLPGELSFPSGHIAFWNKSSFWVKDAHSSGFTGTPITGDFGYLVVSAKPRARVTVNGQVLAVPPPQTVKLPVGKHELKFSYPGYKPKAKKVTIKKDKTAVIEEELKKNSKR